jgi:serralysin
MKNIRCLGLVLVVAMGCAGTDDGALTWEQFKAQAYQEPDTGVFVVNGDEAYDSEELLAHVYQQYLDSYAYFEEGVGTASQALAVYNIGGSDVKWSASQALNLTYCVSQSSFGSRYTTVVNAMARATAAWSQAEPNVQYRHVSSQDGNCNSRNNNVLFNVRQVSTSQYLARAFFPNSSRRGREILVSVSSFGNISPWTLDGILRHELGHTLGMRHEHTRPEAGACFEDNNWRALTAYDSSSVMHYPQCNGDQNGDLVITALDDQGVSALY